MEQLRILAAAAALCEFTISELAAYSGANERTVRSTLRRESRFFERTSGAERGSQTGRPATRYRVVDAQAIRNRVQEFGQGVASFIPATMADRAGDNERLAAIVVGEDAVLRAWDAEAPDEQDLLATVALESLSQSMIGTPSDSLDVRAAAVSTFANLARAEARGEQLRDEQLLLGAQAIANLIDVAPTERVRAFLGGLTIAAFRSTELPPVGLLIDEGATPVEVMPELAALSGEWINHSCPESGGALWGQSWTEPLLDRDIVTCVVISDSGTDQEFDESLSRLDRWHVPAFVVSSRTRNEILKAVARAAAAGATFVPALADPALGTSVGVTIGTALATALHKAYNPGGSWPSFPSRSGDLSHGEAAAGSGFSYFALPAVQRV